MSEVGAYEFSVAPDQPIKNLRADGGYTGGIWMEAHLVTDDLLVLIIDADSIEMFTKEHEGVIDDAHVEPYQAADHQAQLEVTFSNSYEVESDYIVTVTDCGPTIAPVVAQGVGSLMPLPQTQTLTFDLRTSGTFSDQNQCTVSLRARTGRLFDLQVVTFPPPADAPRAHYKDVSSTKETRMPPSAPNAVEDDPSRATVDVIKTRNAEIADLKARLEKLEELVAQLADTRKEGER